MKCLTGFSLVFALSVVFFGISLAEDPGNPDSLAFGNPDGAALIVGIDEDVDIPIWLKCDEDLAFINFCVASENEFIPLRVGAFPDGPLADWEMQTSPPADGWPVTGQTTQAFYGIADYSLPDPNFINTEGQWVQVGRFVLHTIDDTQAFGQVSHLHPGEDPVQGLTVMFDPTWSAIVPAMKFSPLQFITTRPPEFLTPSADTLIAFNNRYPFSFEIIATDEDGDDLSIDVDFPYAGYEFEEVESYPGYIHYRFGWTAPDTCHAILPARFIVTDNHDASDTSVANLDISPVTIAVSSDSTLPGYPANADIDLLQAGDNSDVGAFNLLLVWDYQGLTLLDVDFGDELDSWEFINSVMDPVGPGSVRLVGLAHFQNNEGQPFHQGTHRLARLSFQAGDNPDNAGTLYPLEMPIDNFEMNILADSSGYMVYHPELEEGGILIMDIGDVIIGDINLNGTPWEIGDAITFIAHLIDPVTNPFNAVQRIASDCNRDGVPETIADLIYLLAVINGEIDPPGATGPPGAARIELQNSAGTATVSVKSDSKIGGVLLTIGHVGANIVNVRPANSGIDIHYNDVAGSLTVLAVAADLRQGLDGTVFKFDLAKGNPDNLSIDRFEISDIYGRLLEAR